MEHKLEEHSNCEVINCPICDGGLAYCTVCTVCKASLPTECPGKPMTEWEQESIQQGTLDFKEGKWKGFLFR